MSTNVPLWADARPLPFSGSTMTAPDSRDPVPVKRPGAVHRVPMTEGEEAPAPGRVHRVPMTEGEEAPRAPGGVRHVPMREDEVAPAPSSFPSDPSSVGAAAAPVPAACVAASEPWLAPDDVAFVGRSGPVFLFQFTRMTMAPGDRIRLTNISRAVEDGVDWDSYQTELPAFDPDFLPGAQGYNYTVHSDQLNEQPVPDDVVRLERLDAAGEVQDEILVKFGAGVMDEKGQQITSFSSGEALRIKAPNQHFVGFDGYPYAPGRITGPYPGPRRSVVHLGKLEAGFVASEQRFRVSGQCVAAPGVALELLDPNSGSRCEATVKADGSVDLTVDTDGLGPVLLTRTDRERHQTLRLYDLSKAFIETVDVPSPDRRNCAINTWTDFTRRVTTGMTGPDSSHLWQQVEVCAELVDGQIEIEVSGMDEDHHHLVVVEGVRPNAYGPYVLRREDGTACFSVPAQPGRKITIGAGQLFGSARRLKEIYVPNEKQLFVNDPVYR